MARWQMKRETADGTTVEEIEGSTLVIEGHVAQVYDRTGSLRAAFAPGRWDSVMEKPEQ